MNSAVRSPAVFLDKDGTLVEDVPYNVDPAKMVLTRGAGEALAALGRAGFRLLLVSNQSGVARGLFPEAALTAVRRRLDELLEPYGARLDGFRYCPHHPQGSVSDYTRECECRKPRPGMLLEAAREHDIDLDRSWMIGDILDDVEAGCRAGCRSVLVAGGETEWKGGPCRKPVAIASDLREAASIVLEATDLAGERGGSARSDRPKARGVESGQGARLGGSR